MKPYSVSYVSPISQFSSKFFGDFGNLVVWILVQPSILIVIKIEGPNRVKF